jgi:hypothetical protein
MVGSAPKSPEGDFPSMLSKVPFRGFRGRASLKEQVTLIQLIRCKYLKPIKTDLL